MTLVLSRRTGSYDISMIMMVISKVVTKLELWNVPIPIVVLYTPGVPQNRSRVN